MTKTKYLLALIILVIIGLNCQAHRGRWDYDKTEWSDLMLATFEGDSLLIKSFIEQGDAINYTAFPNTHHQLTAIEIAIRIGNKTAFQLLMNTDSIPTLGEYTQRASSQSNALIMEQVLLHGGNVNDTLDNGYSMLMFAATFGSIEVMNILLINGADIFQTRKSDGWNALMLATYQGDPLKVQTLLDRGADKSYRDMNGKRAIDLIAAIYDRNVTVIENKKLLQQILE